MNRKLTKNDWIFLLVLTTLLFLLFFLFYGPFFGKNGSVVTVTVDGSLFGTYDLRTDQTIEITNSKKEVTNLLVIKDRKASVKQANCPDKLCVKQKEICRNHETIVCLPNKVVVTISEQNQGSSGDTPDAIAK